MARPQKGAIRGGAKIAIIDHRMPAKGQALRELTQVHLPLVHLLRRTRVDCHLAQWVVIQDRHALRQQVRRLQPQPHLDGKPRGQRRAAGIEHAAQMIRVRQESCAPPLACHHGPGTTGIQIHTLIPQLTQRADHDGQIRRVLADDLRDQRQRAIARRPQFRQHRRLHAHALNRRHKGRHGTRQSAEVPTENRAKGTPRHPAQGRQAKVKIGDVRHVCTFQP